MRKGIIYLTLLLASCTTVKNKPPLLSVDEMKIIVYQLMQVDEYFTRASIIDTTLRVNKKNIQYYQQIFDLNKVTSTQFYATMDHMERNPIEFKILMDSVTAFSKREKLVSLKEY